MTWKLPSYLEPYREYIACVESAEEDANSTDPQMMWSLRQVILVQVAILQRLYDANLLKEPPEKFTDDEVRAMFTKNTIITDEK